MRPPCKKTLFSFAVALSALASGCGGTPAFDGDRPPLVVEVAPVFSGSPATDEEGVARTEMAAERYAAARTRFLRLAHTDDDPARRAEHMFWAAECALGEQEYYHAYLLYLRLRRDYPSTRLMPRAVERIFLVGRLFCEGAATKPSWLFGIALTDRAFGIKILERFQKARERHGLSDDALHYVALARLDLDEWELAIDSWEKLQQVYPDREWAETAEYRVALTTLQMSEGPAYDKVPIRSALKRLRRYVQRHPTGNHVGEAQKRLREVEEGLARHQLDVARFYLRRDKYYSADIYLTAVQRDYPGTEAASEARTMQNKLPRTSPPPPPPDPEGLEVFEDIKEDRLRVAPAPIDETW